MTSRWKDRICNTVGLAAIAICTHNKMCPNHQFIKYTYQKEVASALDSAAGLDSVYKHEDYETTILLNTISGFVDKCELKTLLRKKYGFADNEIFISDSIKKDVALYKTIWEIHTKYGNSKLTFKGYYKNLETDSFQHKRARYFPNTIHIHNMDSIRFKFTDPINSILEANDYQMHDTLNLRKDYDQIRELGENRQIYLIKNELEEVPHSYQTALRGELKMGIDFILDYMKCGFDYDTVYSTSGTFEYEAHNIIEPALYQEFVETYKKHSDMDNEQNLLMLGLFYSGYFSDYILDRHKASEYFLLAAEKGNPLGLFLKGKTLYNQWNKLYEYVHKPGDYFITLDTFKHLEELEFETRRSLTIASQKGVKAGAYSLLGDMAYILDEPYSHINYYLLVAKELQKKVGKGNLVSDNRKLAYCYQRLGNAYSKVGLIDQAYWYHEKAYELAAKLGEELE